MREAILTADLARGIPVAFARHPMGGGIWRDVVPEGQTLAEIVASVPMLHDRFEDIGSVMVDEIEVPLAYWSRRPHEQTLTLRPKVCARPIWITLHMTPQNGGRGVKSILSIVASVALVAVGAFLTGGGAAGLLPGLFAAGSTSAAALAAGVTILGRLALLLLAPPAARQKQDKSGPQIGSAGADSNMLQPGGPVPRVLAAPMKVYPPMAAQPLIDLQGDDEIVECAYILAGPHKLEDLRIEGTSVSDIDNLQISVLEGFDTIPTSILNRYGNQRSPNFELLGFKLTTIDTADAWLLRHPEAPDRDLPQWRVEVSASDPDEIWLQLTWPAGMTYTSKGLLALPFRLRMRVLGTSAWINLPELMFSAKVAQPFTKMIRLKWGPGPSPIVDSAQDYGGWQSYHTVPNASLTPDYGDNGWVADASFQNSPTVYNSVKRVERAYEGFTLWLDPAVFPRGNRWEVGIKRGYLIKRNEFTPSTYVYATVIVSMFGAIASGGAAARLNWGDKVYDGQQQDKVVLSRFASVKNQVPIGGAGHATIEVKGRALQISQLSAKASAYVPDWNGSEWTGLVTSSNPGTHLHHVLADRFTSDPVESAILDNAALVAFRQRCIDRDYQIAASFDGRDWMETLQAIASCGRARIRAGALWGVAMDRDTSAETPVQIFSSRHTNNFVLNKPFAAVPDAMRVSFRNRDNDWNQEERLVIRPGLTREEVKDITPVDAVGIDRASAIDDYFEYIQLAAWLRDHTVTFDAHIDSLVAQMGDLVGASHIILSRHHATARVKTITLNGGGLATSMTLDAPHREGDPTSLALATDLAAIVDMFEEGVSLACAIATSAGSTLVAALNAVNAETSDILFATPLNAATVMRGNLVVIGEAATVFDRYLIKQVQGTRRFDARLTVIPECPELWS